jgi:hypothetical protein
MVRYLPKTLKMPGDSTAKMMGTPDHAAEFAFEATTTVFPVDEI